MDRLRDGWALLPQSYAFFGPLYSTGLAWSFLGVERLLDVLLESGGELRRRALADYDALLAAEADHVECLLASTDRAFETAGLQGNLDAVARATRLYFVAASWQETQQRLFDRRERPGSATLSGWAWDSFLGADDPPLRDAVRAFAECQRRKAPGAERGVRELLRSRDVGGFTDTPTRRQVGVSLDTVVAASDRLELPQSEVEARLPRLLGGSWG